MLTIVKTAAKMAALKPVPKASNNLDALDLHEAFEDWRFLPKITEREAAGFLIPGSQFRNGDTKITILKWGSLIQPYPF